MHQIVIEWKGWDGSELVEYLRTCIKKNATIVAVTDTEYRTRYEMTHPVAGKLVKAIIVLSILQTQKEEDFKP